MGKSSILLFGLLLCMASAFSQSSIDSLIDQGIKYHDQGDYQTALDYYQRALAIDSTNARAAYESSMTLLYMGKFDESMRYSERVLQQGDQYKEEALVTKASCLDELGRTPESIDILEQTIKSYGGHYLLYFNLGIDYYHIKDYSKAEEAFINAIRANPGHASSHLFLGYVMGDQGSKTESILSLSYFLLLEPNSKRSLNAYTALMNEFQGNVSVDPSKPNSTNITIDESHLKSEFGSAELALSILDIPNPKDSAMSDEEHFINKTTEYFKILGEMKKKKNKGLWWEFYIPFFYDLANSGQIEAYCYYISQSGNSSAADWVDAHPGAIGNMNSWVASHPPASFK